ncbi:TonB-dependent receptor [Novosphingobium sp. PS1R-30]|uniref:TonB-dependent receptor n=1 Tax=Novosphingobium anseongense TaxID=3133436 RepID=A0ABU8RXX1_9SPHN
MRKLALVLALACSSHATIAAAQAGGAAEADNSGEIVVTAQKREERLLEVPISISVMSGEDMVQNGINSTVNLSQAAPGIVTVNNGFGFLPVVRGIQSTGTSPGDETNVAIYLDDVSIGTPIAGFFDLADIERIEVLKGPQGTLYGRNATGGAIKIVTKKPSFETSGSVAADYGFHYNELKVTGFVTGGITDQLAGSLSGSYRTSDGFIKGTGPNVGRDFGGADNYVLRGKLLWQPSESFSAVLSGDVWRQQNNSVFISHIKDGINPYPNVPGTVPNRPYENAGSTDPLARLRGFGGSLDLNWDSASGISVRSLTAYRHVAVNSQSDTDRTSIGTGNAVSGSNQISQYQKSFSEELTVSSPADGMLTWLVGGYYYNSKAGNPYFRTYSGDAVRGGTIAANFTNRMRSEVFAGFGEATLNLGESLHVTGGVRYNSEKKTFHWQNLVNLAAAQVDRERTWNSATWRGVVRYDLAEDANVYFSASTGFKSGVYNAYSSLGIPVNPEKITAFELGAKARVSGINLTLAGYAYKYKDIQVSSYTQVGNPPTLQLTLSNAARAKMRGLEFTADGKLGGGFSFAAGLSWEPKAEYEAFTAAQVTVPLTAAELAVAAPGIIQKTVVPFDASGSRTVRTPEVTGNLRLSYEADLWGGEFNGSVNTAYTGAFYWQPGNLSREDPYAIVNFRLSWTKNRVTYSVFGNNVTDAGYRTDYVPNARGDSVKFVQREEFGVGVSFAF